MISNEGNISKFDVVSVIEFFSVIVDEVVYFVVIYIVGLLYFVIIFFVLL